MFHPHSEREEERRERGGRKEEKGMKEGEREGWTRGVGSKEKGRRKKE